MKVLFTPEVTTHIDFLIPLLYELRYFRDKEKYKSLNQYKVLLFPMDI